MHLLKITQIIFREIEIDRYLNIICNIKLYNLSKKKKMFFKI